MKKLTLLLAICLFTACVSQKSADFPYNVPAEYLEERADIPSFWLATTAEVEEFIKTRLDPLAKQFIDDVCSVRSIAENSEALRGKIYYAMNAMPEGLIDGRNTLEEVIAELQNLMPAPADELTIDINNLKIQL